MDKKSQFEAVLLLAVKSLEMALREIDQASGQSYVAKISEQIATELRAKFDGWMSEDPDLIYKYYDLPIFHPFAPELNFIVHLGVGKSVCGISLLFRGSTNMRDLVHCAHELIWSSNLPDEFSCLGLTEEQLKTFRTLRSHRYDGYSAEHSAPVVTYWL